MKGKLPNTPKTELDDRQKAAQGILTEDAKRIREIVRRKAHMIKWSTKNIASTIAKTLEGASSGIDTMSSASGTIHPKRSFQLFLEELRKREVAFDLDALYGRYVSSVQGYRDSFRQEIDYLLEGASRKVLVTEDSLLPDEDCLRAGLIFQEVRDPIAKFRIRLKKAVKIRPIDYLMSSSTFFTDEHERLAIIMGVMMKVLMQNSIDLRRFGRHCIEIEEDMKSTLEYYAKEHPDIFERAALQIDSCNLLAESYAR